MAVIEPNDLVILIKAKFPEVDVDIKDEGPAPGFPFRRHSISFFVYGAQVTANLGENLTFLVDGVPREVLQHISLLDPDKIKATFQVWLNEFKKYLKDEEVPEVQALARQHLGKELRVIKKKKALYVSYDKFYIIITPTSAHLHLKTTHRLVLYKKIEKKGDFKKFFRLAENFSKEIRKGQIK